jgi:PKHD-type hydroxylase
MRIALPPIGNPRWSEVVTHHLFDDADCDAALGTLDVDAWRPAGLADDTSYDKVDRTLRSAELQLLPADGWPFGRLMQALSDLNAEVHRFDLHGLDPIDAPSILRYEAGSNDHFRPHQDIGPSNPTRKVTFVVQLTAPDDYYGGDLVFPELGRSGPRDRGTLIVFPSFLQHVVSPVLSGTRHAIVGWLHGPTFS